MWLCTQVCALLCSSCVYGDHLQLDNFITAHLVLFILITQAAKLRLRIQAFQCCMPSLSLQLFSLKQYDLIMTVFFLHCQFNYNYTI